ncbi:septum formation inhibitor Maf [Maribacter sp. CXY002]|uniref:septum formation inhibitor Maf n=1 Tax=Maribacter luteocoastalis TaxID=3407671 RepID=UPI003B684EBE
MFKKWLRFETAVLLAAVLFSLLNSCKDQTNDTDNVPSSEKAVNKNKSQKVQLSDEFKSYWYAGDAEISSYKLEQARYGELRDGNAVLIYVTEPFLPELQVKADESDPSNIPVLKLNATKNYITGIYPYSIMTSSFYPVYDNEHALKVSFSSQEWCGHVYAQVNNRSDFEIMSHSYFGSEADQEFHLEKTVLENEIWNKIRVNHKNLPVGEISMIPSLEYIRLSHKELKAYKAITSFSEKDDISIYSIVYPELQRTLKISFMNSFPYTIEGWTDSFKGGFGQAAKILTSTATKIKTIKSPYWQQNSNKDLYLRDSLGL